MSKPRKARPPDDAAQSARFIATAKESGADENGAAFEAALGAIAPRKTAVSLVPKRQAKKKTSG